jgi:hypothetical protein
MRGYRRNIWKSGGSVKELTFNQLAALGLLDATNVDPSTPKYGLSPGMWKKAQDP